MAAWKRAVLVALAVLVGILSAAAQTEHRPGSRPVSLELWGSSITVQEFLSFADSPGCLADEGDLRDRYTGLPPGRWNTTFNGAQGHQRGTQGCAASFSLHLRPLYEQH